MKVKPSTELWSRFRARPRAASASAPAGRGRWTKTTVHVTGYSLLFVAAGILLSALVELIDGDNGLALLAASAVVAIVALACWWPTQAGRLSHASVFAVVGTTWIAASVVGALPYLFAGTFALPGRPWSVVLVDALFESISGFSGTGSTVFGLHNPVEAQGSGLLLYRQLTQWAGGMGIVVLVVMVLPSLRSSGLGLIDAEAPGIGVDRLAPRVKNTAAAYWAVYVFLTVVLALGLFVAGMGPFDAVAHALSGVGNGGFSTKTTSIGHWNSLAIEVVVMVAMVIGGVSFALHRRAAQRREFGYWRDREFRAYVGILATACLVVSVLLVDSGMSITSAFRAGVFNVVALGTSSGFANSTGAGSPGDFASWAAGPQVLLLLLLVVGGCTGSTAGGVKVMRLRVGMSHAYRTLRSFRHPRALLPARLGSNVIADSVVERIAGFMVIYGLLVVGGTVVVAALGVDLVTAASGVISALSNMGPALGEAGPTASFADAYPAPARIVLALLMLVGRLEIFPMLLMLVMPYRAVRSGANQLGKRLRHN